MTLAHEKEGCIRSQVERFLPEVEEGEIHFFPFDELIPLPDWSISFSTSLPDGTAARIGRPEARRVYIRPGVTPVCFGEGSPR